MLLPHLHSDLHVGQRSVFLVLHARTSGTLQLLQRGTGGGWGGAEWPRSAIWVLLGGGRRITARQVRQLALLPPLRAARRAYKH